MGKKVKKKVRSAPKEKRGPSMSPITVSQEGTDNAETPVNGVVVIKDRGVCCHVDKGINLDNFSAKLRSTDSTKCEDCRGNVADRRAKKGQVKGKKGGANTKSESRAIWICLECGHYACSGVGLPTTHQSHAVRHSKQNHHPLVVHYENHKLLWCFPCNKLVHGENFEDHKHKDLLNEVVKMLKGKPGEGSTIDVEDVWFGSGSVTSAVKSDYSVSTDANGKASHSIRGLCNLGNTCFFNSVMQNLFAINRLRDYFFKLDESFGPLSAAMKKIFLETNNECGSKGVINPRSVFGSLCTKAPQFKGYQQHDSHELLRCLLDGMSTEELNVRKHTKASDVSVKDPTFVDVIFGGQLSSTVSCLECGHSSTIYEPFLDLSLPVPTKKPPPKRYQPPTRGKKPKLPPKRSGRNLSKVSREANSLPRKSALDKSTISDSSGDVHSLAQPTESLVLALGDSELSDSADPNNVALDMGLSAKDLSAFQNPENQPAVQSVGEQSNLSDLSWLDYLDPESNDYDAASETDDTSGIHDSANEDIRQHDVSVISDSRMESNRENVVPEIPSDKPKSSDALEHGVIAITSDSRMESNLENVVQEILLDKPKSSDSIEHGVIAQERNTSLQFEDKQTIESHCDGRILAEGSLTKDGVEYDAGIDHSSPSCSETKESNTSEKDDDSSSQVLDPIVMSCQNQEAVTSSVEDIRAEAEVSSAMVGNEQDSLDFDGFGDMFNEPEEPSGDKPKIDMTKSGVNGNNTSESDADEVDNADAPVTVESCLAFFTKPELLSKDEHAWQCDNCSKLLREQRIKSRRVQIPVFDTVPNSCENGVLNGLLDDGKSHEMVNCMNGNSEADPSDGGPLPHNREICENGKCNLGGNLETEINNTVLQSENKELQATYSCPGSSECSNISNQNLNSYRGECDSDKNGYAESDLLSVKREPEVDKPEDVNTETLKVKRDATKSILIDKAPSILTIHLKRFSQDARGRLSKLNGHVSFRESIHLKPYMDPRSSENTSFHYRLVGVVEHLGTMRGGHYVAYVRGSKDYGDCVWYHASDAYVRQASLEEVLRCEAYILFYERT